MSTENLVTINELPKRLKNKNITVGILRQLKARRQIPFLKLGHRTLLFDPVAVADAIDKLAVQPHAPRGKAVK